MRKLMIGLAALALAGTASAVSAQEAGPKAYMIAELDVKDPEAFRVYAAQVPKLLALYGGHYLARGGEIIPLEGKPGGDRIVVIEFPSLERAQAFYHSPDYQAIASIRHKAAKGPAFIVTGVAP